ncbi:hypothetical protein [Ruegeria marina]|uniref:Uncharacterized protein n=1 Tax=Ruegeria marina TaxID=639004 RepID=A0A1G6IA83_9RHOB|nr:hypothetical protein [Ruegeria marina]SDC03452.1 hypothetical protein SAMN04488239_10169 [Ruegeria marina]
MTPREFVISESIQAPTGNDGRYEYRVWPRPGHPAIAILNSNWPLVAAERRSDIYLVHAASDRILVKLRSGRRLEIKRREGDVGRIQYWTMPFTSEFPLTASGRHRLAGALSLHGDLPRAASLSPAHLLAAIDARDGRVFPQTVRKSRMLFRNGGCRAEICRVAVGGWTGRTVALEAPDLPSIALAIDPLHLGTLANRSYGDALSRLFAPHLERRGTPLDRPGLLVRTQLQEKKSQ